MTPAARTDPPPCEPSAGAPAPAEAPAKAQAPLPPGSPAAVAAGCRCSVLANAAYRCGAGEPLLDPSCPLEHGVGPG
jgi:hypothetical protein